MKKCKLCLIMMIVCMSACHKTVDAPAAGEIMTLQLYKDGKPASNVSTPGDNYTYATVVAVLDSTIVDTTNAVSFTTDAGTFSNGTASVSAKIDLHGKAYAYLKSASILTAHVQATVGSNNVQNIDVPFSTSWPDKLLINLPATASDTFTNRITITATLKKNMGMPSAGFELGFYATDTSGKPKGSFNNITLSDSDGNVSVQYWLQDSMYKNFITIKGFLVRSPGDSIIGINKMLFTK